MKKLALLLLLPPIISFSQSNLDSNLFVIENAFTPNSSQDINGFGPYFRPGLVIQSYDFKIYNRWGEMLFESDNPENNWDCTLPLKKGKSVPVPDGTYVWILSFSLKGEDSQEHKGNVTILR